MKTIKEKTKANDYTRPGEPMTQDEFETHIKKAEKGPFTDWSESKKDFEVWKKTVKK